MIPKLLILVDGGSVGTLCRYFVAEWGQERFGTWLPYGTLLVNILGCLIMGLVLGWFETRHHALTEMPYVFRLLLMSGFLGAFTTFSSYQLEALLFLRQGAWERALLYLVGSVILGLLLMSAGVQLGCWMARWMARG